MGRHPDPVQGCHRDPDRPTRDRWSTPDITRQQVTHEECDDNPDPDVTSGAWYTGPNFPWGLNGETTNRTSLTSYLHNDKDKHNQKSNQRNRPIIVTTDGQTTHRPRGRGQRPVPTPFRDSLTLPRLSSTRGPRRTTHPNHTLLFWKHPTQSRHGSQALGPSTTSTWSGWGTGTMGPRPHPVPVPRVKTHPYPTPPTPRVGHPSPVGHTRESSP